MIYSWCDGGFGNRFYSLVNSYGLSKILDRKIKIFWPQTNWSDSNFLDIFDVFDDSVQIATTDDFKVNLNEYCDAIFSHVSCPYSNKNFLYKTDNLDQLKEKSKQNSNIYYSDNMKHENLFNLNFFFKNFNFKKEILSYVNNFSDKFFDENTIGIHLRTTDVCDYQYYTNWVGFLIRQNPNKRFFICSDSNDAEIYFKNMFGDRIILNSKNSEVVKYDQSKPWKFDHEPHFNVYRSQQQTIDGIKDLLLLSKLQTKYNFVHSTFFSLSIEITNYNKG